MPGMNSKKLRNFLIKTKNNNKSNKQLKGNTENTQTEEQPKSEFRKSKRARKEPQICNRIASHRIAVEPEPEPAPQARLFQQPITHTHTRLHLYVCYICVELHGIWSEGEEGAGGVRINVRNTQN